MLIEEVILGVINEHGLNVLDSEKEFFTLIDDYSNNTLSDSVDFLNFKACYTNGLSAFAKNIYYEKNAEKLALLSQKAKSHLVNRKRLSETSVISGINIFLKAFGKKFQLPQTYLEKNVNWAIEDDVESPNDNKNKCEECLFIHNISVTAKKWFIERLHKALAGDVEAMVDVANCYKKGNIVQKNWRIAEKWYKDVIEDNKEKVSVNVVEKAKNELIELYNELDESYYR